MNKQEFIEENRISLTGKVDISLYDIWEYILSVEKPSYDITGKYLFFSNDRELLQQIAITEIENNGFHRAKLPIYGFSEGDDYVLCLYYKDDSRKKELAERYRNAKNVKYRYWKSDQATIDGIYSEQFLQVTKKQQE